MAVARRRNARPPSKLMGKRRRHLQEINSWTPKLCCKQDCTSKVGVEECRRLRELYLASSQCGRKSMLRSQVTEESGRSFAFGSHPVCWKFIISTLEISRTLIANVLCLPSATASHLPGRTRGSNSSETMKTGVIDFLRILADDIADELSNSHQQRPLPHGNKQIVFALYSENERKYGRRPSSQSHFYGIWKAFAPHIKCRRNHGFTVCDSCTDFKETLEISLAFTDRNVEEMI